MPNIYAPPNSPVQDMEAEQRFPKRPFSLTLLCVWIAVLGLAYLVYASRFTVQNVHIDLWGPLVILLAYGLLKGSNVARYLALIGGLIPIAWKLTWVVALTTLGSADLFDLLRFGWQGFVVDACFVVPVWWVCFHSEAKQYFRTKQCPNCRGEKFGVSFAHPGALQCKACRLVSGV